MDVSKTMPGEKRDVEHMHRFQYLNLSLLCFVLGYATAGIPMEAQKLTPLNVQMVEVDSTKLPALIAADQGIFRKNGLAVNLFIATGARDVSLRRDVHIPEQFVRDDRSAPITMGGSFGFARISYDAERNPDRVFISSLDPMIHWKIIGSKDIVGLEGLKGKRLASADPGRNETDIIARALIQQTHWDPLFDIALLNATPDMVSLREGAVDAIIASEVPEAVALANGYHVIFDTSVWKIAIPGSGINTTRSWLKVNHDTAVRFMKSIVEGIAMMRNNPDAAYRSIAKWYNITNPEYQKIIYNGTRDMERVPYPSVEGVKTIMKLYDSMEMRKHKPEEFYDDSILRELDRSGFVENLYK